MNIVIQLIPDIRNMELAAKFIFVELCFAHGIRKTVLDHSVFNFYWVKQRSPKVWIFPKNFFNIGRIVLKVIFLEIWLRAENFDLIFHSISG